MEQQNAIYRFICAFTNFFDNTGDSYIVMDVTVKKGLAIMIS